MEAHRFLRHLEFVEMFKSWMDVSDGRRFRTRAGREIVVIGPPKHPHLPACDATACTVPAGSDPGKRPGRAYVDHREKRRREILLLAVLNLVKRIAFVEVPDEVT